MKRLAVVGLGLALLTSCGTATPSSTAPSTQAVAAVAWAEWRPATLPERLPKLSEEEKQRLRATRLQQDAQLLARMYEVQAPAPESIALERWVPADEVADTMVACLQESGWQARKVGTTGVAAPNLPPEQASAFALAQYTCTARYTPDPDYSQGLTPSQIGVQYDYFTTWLTPCLERRGFTPSEPPTREVFVAAGSNSPWDPYRELFRERRLNEDSAEAAEWLAECPRQPPLAAMYP